MGLEQAVGQNAEEVSLRPCEESSVSTLFCKTRRLLKLCAGVINASLSLSKKAESYP